MPRPRSYSQSTIEEPTNDLINAPTHTHAVSTICHPDGRFTVPVVLRALRTRGCSVVSWKGEERMRMGMRKVLGEGGGALGGELEDFHFISFPARWRPGPRGGGGAGHGELGKMDFSPVGVFLFF